MPRAGEPAIAPRFPPRAGCDAVARFVERPERQERPEQVEEDGVDGLVGRGHRRAAGVRRRGRPELLDRAPRLVHGALVLDRAEIAGSRSRATAFSTRRMILPLRVFGSIATNDTWLITATGPSSWRTVAISSRRSLRRLVADAQRDERLDDLAAQLVRDAGDARLGDRRMPQERRLDLDRPDPVVGDLDDLVGPAGEPDVAVLVLVRGIADVVAAGVFCQ